MEQTFFDDRKSLDEARIAGFERMQTDLLALAVAMEFGEQVCLDLPHRLSELVPELDPEDGHVSLYFFSEACERSYQIGLSDWSSV
jgi:hypothetical protein